MVFGSLVAFGLVMVWFGYGLVNHGNLVMVSISPTVVKLVWFMGIWYI